MIVRCLDAGMSSVQCRGLNEPAYRGGGPHVLMCRATQGVSFSMMTVS